MLAHTASHEGIVAVANICGHEEVMNYNSFLHVYLEPEIASIGLTEAQAKEKYENVKVGKFPLQQTARLLLRVKMKVLSRLFLTESLMKY